METTDGVVAGSPQRQRNRVAEAKEGQHVIAFLLSRPFSNIFTAPLSRITILFQVKGMHSSKPPPTIFREFSRIVTEERFKSLWKGNLASIVRAPPYFAMDVLICSGYYKFLQLVFGLEHPEKPSSAQVCMYTTVEVLSGSIASSAVYPMDLVRTRLAAQRSRMHYNGIRHALSTIYQEEGFLGLYKGNAASVLRKAPEIAMSCYCFELLEPRSSYGSERIDGSFFYKLMAAFGVCGVVSSLATYPMDVVRKRLQLDGAGGKAKIYNTGLVGTFKHIIKMEGLRGLYRGILPDFLKVFPRVGLYFMTYKMLKRNGMYTTDMVPDK